MITINVKKLLKEILPAELVAVTKTRTAEEIKEAIGAGCRIIGENKIQEAEKKYHLLNDYMKSKNVKLHFIGHLQSNKAKKAAEMSDVIETVDSLKLAGEIDKRAKEITKIQEIFIQVNIGDEPQKSGISPANLPSLLDRIRTMKNINLTGLMCIPPHSASPEDSRIYFKKMKKLFDNSGLKYLSMGMTGDYKIALEEGSNIVRIGTGIFGERKY